MRLKKVKGASETIEKSPYYIKDNNMKGSFNTLFSNNNRIEIEIGTGKGSFIIEKAKRNPNINYIGIEKYDSVLVRAVEKLQDIDLPNLKLMLLDATLINDVFDKEINLLYLNFSDPWPKKRHTHRRLTSPLFLEKYTNLFKEQPHIIMKTDNRKLFEYSIKSLTDYGYKIIDLSLDLYNDDYQDNIPTEYETKFHKKGNVIYMIEVIK